MKLKYIFHNTIYTISILALSSSLAMAASTLPLANDDCEWARGLLDTSSSANNSIVIGPKERACMSALKNKDMSLAAKKQETIPPAAGSGLKLKLTPEQPTGPQQAASTTPPQAQTGIDNPTSQNTTDTVPAGVTFNIMESNLLLSKNLSEAFNKNGWKTPPGWWDTNIDFNIVSSFSVYGKDVYEVTGKILQKYGLVAKFFTWDHTVRIMSINDKGNN